MSWVPAEKVLSTVAAQRKVLTEQEARIARATQEHAAQRQTLEAERAQAMHDLGQAVLQKLDVPSIANAAQTVGLVGLPNENINAKLEARRAWLARRLAEIDRDPRYANREMLRHPRTGSLMTAIAEAEDYRKPANEVLARCNDHPRFARLLSTGFGTPEYTGSWWRYSYWVDRSAADEIVAGFPGKTTFAEVREEYRLSSETVDAFDADLARLRGEVAAGEALEREHAALDDEHRNIDARGLEHTRGRIVQHLLTSDASLVSQRLAGSSALRLLFLRASGLTAKLSYLDGIHTATVQELQKELATQHERLDGVETRTRRRWAPMQLDNFRKVAEDRRPRYEKKWQRYGKVYTQVYTFDRWDRGRRFEDLLWWDLMTRGRYDGSYIHEVNEFHRVHPDYEFDANAMKGSNAEFFGQGRAADERSDHASDAANDDAASDDAEAAAASADADADIDTPGDTVGTDAS